MKNQKILVVEDSDSIGRIITTKIENELGLQTVWFKTFTETSAYLEQNTADIFLGIIDLHLPDAGADQIVNLVLDYDIPAVPLTSDYSDEMQNFMWNKRVVDYIVKEGNHSIEYLVRLIKQLIQNSSIKILIVDDSKATRHLLRNYLDQHRYQIMEAEDGNKALALIEENPDTKLIITDFKMPGMNGFDLVREVRLRYPIDRIGIIGISAENNTRLAAKFIKYGANDFLVKPFCKEQLYCRVSQNIHLINQFDTIRNVSVTDHLTGLYNRRYLFERAPEIISAGIEAGFEFAVAILDIDYFKSVNDTLGHQAGDIILFSVAARLKQNLPEPKLVVRFGGEEFCILYVNEEKADIKSVFENLCRAVHMKPFVAKGASVDITISAGVYVGTDRDLDKVLSIADQRLYKAKNLGRNQVCFK
jgi:diguanylate cyclase (GGDEF)-like protein